MTFCSVNSEHQSIALLDNVPRRLSYLSLPYALPELSQKAHACLSISLTFLCLFALPDKTLLVNLRLASPDIRLRRANVLRLVPHFPRDKQHNKVPDAKVRSDEAFGVPGCECVKAQSQDDTDTNHNAPIACIRRQRRLIWREPKDIFCATIA